MDNFEKYYNKGNDCDTCSNKYLSGTFGDEIGCKCIDEDKECEYQFVKAEEKIS
jgi:hypothetical protein